jgi:hypothetical protein
VQSLLFLPPLLFFFFPLVCVRFDSSLVGASGAHFLLSRKIEKREKESKCIEVQGERE